MKRSGRRTGWLLAVLLFSCNAMAAAPPAAAGDHSAHAGHEMAGGAERDELGRRLYGMKHQISPEIANELRRKVPLFRNYSDAQIGLSMEMMGPNYEWYLSDPGLKADEGVLILVHGFKNADDRFKRQIESLANIFPLALAPGMSMVMSEHIQLAIDDLEAAGAKTIVVVPVVSTRYNTMLRQWEYIFGLRDEAPYASVPRVHARAKIRFAPPPGDDPHIAEILLDHAHEISTDPSREVVIIAAHGPTFEDDNRKALAELETLARYMREDGDFADVEAITLQDDAPPAIRARNVEKLRGMVEAANAKGLQVLVVTNLIGTRTIQAKLRKDLAGLDYKFNAKGVVAHPNFMKWMGEAIRHELESAEAQAAAVN